MVKIGTFLYHWRGLIGFTTFWFAWLFSHPNLITIFVSLPFIIIGLLLRFWAIGYIGKESRSNSLKAKSLVTDGPYNYIRNPLYLGNFFLTLGVILALNLAVYLLILIIVLFWVYYSIIIKTEQDFLLKQFGEEYQSYQGKTGAIFPKHLTKQVTCPIKKRYSFCNAMNELQTLIILIIIYGLIYLHGLVKI